MNTTLNSNLNEKMNQDSDNPMYERFDDFSDEDFEKTLNKDDDTLDEEPAWKSRAPQTNRLISYSRKSKEDKFLDENKADENREKFLDLFCEDPNLIVCDKEQFEKELFTDLKDPKNDERKRTKKKKGQNDNENLEFSTKNNRNNRNKHQNQKDKLQKLFEKSKLYHDLQALKNEPLNIQEVDKDGKILKRVKYYFDYETNKHQYIEVESNDDVNNDDKNERPESPLVSFDSEDEEELYDTKIEELKKTEFQSKDHQNNKKQQSIKSNDISKTYKQFDNSIMLNGKASTPKSNKSKRKIINEDDNEYVEKSTPNKKLKITEQQQVVNQRPIRSTRNLKRKVYDETKDDEDEENIEANRSKSKRKTKK